MILQPTNPTCCPLCEGSEQRITVSPAGRSEVLPCSCRNGARLARTIAAANIPIGLRFSSLGARSWQTRLPEERAAHAAATTYLEQFPNSNGTGLLFVGDRQDLKSTLAVGLLLALMQRHRVRGIFCRYRVMLRQLRAAYHQESDSTEQDLLEPLLAADVLLVDELGGGMGTHGFAADAFAYLLDSRYRQLRPTLITSNYVCEPACARAEATLGDRIGNHLLSRLTEVSSIVTLPFRPRQERTAA